MPQSAFRFDIPKFLLLPSTLYEMKQWKLSNHQRATYSGERPRVFMDGSSAPTNWSPRGTPIGQLVITICATRCEKIRIRTVHTVNCTSVQCIRRTVPVQLCTRVSYACIDWIRDAGRAGLGPPKLKYLDWFGRLTFSLIHFTKLFFFGASLSDQDHYTFYILLFIFFYNLTFARHHCGKFRVRQFSNNAAE